MTQYEIKNAAERVDGYYLPRPSESMQHMRRSLEQTQELTFEQWHYLRS